MFTIEPLFAAMHIMFWLILLVFTAMSELMLAIMAGSILVFEIASELAEMLIMFTAIFAAFALMLIMFTARFAEFAIMLIMLSQTIMSRIVISFSL